MRKLCSKHHTSHKSKPFQEFFPTSTTKTMKSTNSKALLFLISYGLAEAFVDPLLTKRAFLNRSGGGLNSYAPSQQEYESNYLFQDFRTSNGEIINPYEVLQVDRTANRMEIKKNYRTLSKLFHPDGVRFADALPANW